MAAKAAKGALYASELDAARLRGDWTAEHPTHLAGKGKNITWPELIRKYMKHNPNSPVTPGVASVEQQLHASIAAFQSQKSSYSDSSHDADVAIPGQKDTTVLPEPIPADESGEGWSGKEILAANNRLEDLAASARGDDLAKHSVAALRAYALFSVGKDEDAIGLLHNTKFLEEVNLDALKAGDHLEDYAVALMLLGFCVYGMANERLHASRNNDDFRPFVLAGYARAIDLHEGVRGGKRAGALRGLPADEIEAWGETALYRNALFSVRHGDLSLGLNALRAYQAHTGRWPASFRNPQRNAIYRTYLNLLNISVEQGGYVGLPAPTTASKDDWRSFAYQKSVVNSVAARMTIRDFEAERVPRHGQARRMLGAEGRGITSRTTSTRRPAPHRALRPSSATWSNELLTVQASAAASILRSTEFPRAGQVNISALQLADAVVKGWQLNGEQAGEHADEIVEILYSLTKITFHSQRVSRHLFTVLVAAEAYDEARLALELYIQIFEKAAEADAAGSSALVEEARLRKEEDDARGYEIQENKVEERDGDTDARQTNGISDAAKKAGEAALQDHDDEEVFVSTLLYGAHVLTRYLGDAEASDRIARKALDKVAASTKLGNSRSLVARAKRVAGTARAAFCAHDATPHRRQELHDEALSLLKQSATLEDQSSETYYQLAYLQAEMRDIPSAIRSARRAVELEPADVQTWHLLTLLRSAQKDFKGALRIAEEGLAGAEDDDEADAQALLRGLATPTSPASPRSASGAFPQSNGIPNGKPSAKLTLARTVLLSVDYPPSYGERAEAVLRLMITHNALEELVEGTDAAIEGQREIFEFFHKRVATTVAAPAPRKAAADPKAAADKRGRLSTLLSSSGTAPHRFGSMSGMGQSGATPSRASTLIHSLHRRRHPVATDEPASAGAVPLPASSAHSEKVDETATAAALREQQRGRQERELLGTLWLMSASSFRRAGKHSECRVAVQEAERIEPARSEVWLQLALWFEQDDLQLALASLYKALACQGDNIAAVVHLARIFLANPDHSPSSVPQVVLEASLATQAHSSTPNALVQHVDRARDEQVSATGQSGGRGAGSKLSPYSSTADAHSSAEKRELSAASLAEGLLTSITLSHGWDSPEAWLYLGQVASKTSRREKARQCLEFALNLEQTKPVRPLSHALYRA
ncbi:TPR-like protein [Ceraceosorus guamensis]|uniref:TPR-like protein n=1 Tax=Ceraceosorus guamensis TaxID=1522189 RepID=A0A316VNY3_9BASI|nr:TPR-like protein [Ceraceosorus guamensis]PWN39349.1 TPR-like protein [Ceraceosorus guamensis]